MERDIDLKEISDGRLYRAGDMVKTGCNDCKGCSLCCSGMGSSIILDPYDIYQLEAGMHLDFSALMQEKIELNVVEGVILPNLKMQKENDACAFLNAEGRCGVHACRPGFCRMFPLGRIYEGEDFLYFLQVHECPYPGKTKVKVKKWLGIPELSEYEEFIRKWHAFLKKLKEYLKENENEEIGKRVNLFVLNQFFKKSYDTQSRFYPQFYRRLEESKSVLGGGF